MSEQNIPAQAHVDNEEWRPIPSTDGYYEASSCGRIRRAKPGMGTFVGKILHPVLVRGYSNVSIHIRGRKRQLRKVHRLVAEVFLGDGIGLEVNHKNGIKADNALDNLEYVTQSQNVAHAAKMNLVAFGSRNGNARLNEDDVVQIKNRLSGGETHQEIAKDYGVHRMAIMRIHRNRTWNRVSVAEVLH